MHKYGFNIPSLEMVSVKEIDSLSPILFSAMQLYSASSVMRVFAIVKRLPRSIGFTVYLRRLRSGRPSLSHVMETGGGGGEVTQANCAVWPWRWVYMGEEWSGSVCVCVCVCVCMCVCVCERERERERERGRERRGTVARV